MTDELRPWVGLSEPSQGLLRKLVARPKARNLGIWAFSRKESDKAISG